MTQSTTTVEKIRRFEILEMEPYGFTVNFNYDACPQRFCNIHINFEIDGFISIKQIFLLTPQKGTHFAT